MSGPYTVVSYHAHPDDEALFTGGTLARAAADGHRVVLAVATDGEAGLTAARFRRELGQRRADELASSAAELGVARVVRFGHRDSGWSPSSGPPTSCDAGSFSALDPQALAEELATLLAEESADVLTTYDAAGGYGHPDHVQVHRVGALAATMAGTPVVLEATVDRTAIRRGAAVVRALGRILPVPELPDLEAAFTESASITHRVDVRRHLRQKKRALARHASQAGGTARTVSLLGRLPPGLDRVVLGREWFREVGRTPGPQPVDDIFATLRTPEALARHRVWPTW